ncbi:MAG: PAS domain S-box protein [Theionarchaea archaeon]|nr:PAS domain S-box protein [Theionarchaea archaeon]
MKNESNPEKQRTSESFTQMKEEALDAERTRVRNKLTTTQVRLQHLLTFSPAVIYTREPHSDYRTTFVSKNIKDQMGYEPDEFVDDSQFWVNHVHPEDAQRIFDDLGHLIEKGHYTNEYRFQHKDGTYRWVRDKLRMVRDSEGNPLEIVGCWIDITERKKMEEEKDEILHDLQERVKELSCLYGIDEIVRKNLTVEEILEEIVHIIPPSWQYPDITGCYITFEDKEYKTENFEKKWIQKADIVTQGKKVGAVHVCYTEEKPPEDEGPFLKEERNLIESIAKRLGEIIERKTAEEALKDSEKRFRLFFENEPEYCYMVSPEGEIQDINKSALKTLGYEKEEIIGKPLLTTIYAPSSRKTAQQLFAKWKKTGSLKNEELTIITKEGKERTVLLSVDSVKDSSGKVLYSISVQRDITKRKRAEEQLKESEEMYRKLVETSPDAVTVTDLKGRITHVSQKTLELHRVECADELLGKSALTLIAPEDHEKALANLQRTLNEGAVQNVEYTLVRKDGSFFIGELNATLIKDSKGNPRAFIATVRDITERKRAELQIKASLREKEVLLKEIHHRVRNNMQIMSSLLNLQSEQVEDKEIHNILKESQNRIKSMALVHENLYQSEDFANIDFTYYIEALVYNLYWSYEASPERIAVITDMDILLGIDVAIPCGLIINELVSNSLKHAFPGDRKGEIRIAIHEIGENEIALVISDNGVGMPEDFDFRNTESLGLHLVTILAEDQLQGSISLDRSRGTEFQVRFKIPAKKGV